MKITATTFESNYHYSDNCGGGSTSMYEYIRHNIDVYNEITIEEKGVTETFQAMYQTGMHYIHNNYSLPSYELELSDTEGTSELIYKIVNDLGESDFEDPTKISNFLEDNNHKIINTLEKLWEMYYFLRDNQPNISSFEPGNIVIYNENNL